MALEVDYTPPPTGKKFMQSDAKMRVLMGPVGCVAPETLVLTEFGPISIAHIDRPMRVVSWNAKTCRFQLSWCGGSFPKGTDYLHRVSTRQGEFDALGHHLNLCDDGNYRSVQSLSPGQFLRQCSDVPLLTSSVAQLPSPQDALRSTQTAVGYLGGYAELARQRGLRLLEEEGIDRAWIPSQGGAQTSFLSYGWAAAVRTGGLWERLRVRIRQGLSFVLKQIGGFLPPVAPLRPVGASPASALPYEHTEGLARSARQSRQTSGFRLTGRLFSGCFRSFDSSSVSDRAIISVRREKVKRSYWDMQVLDTNNYVTVDGSIHHNSGKSVTCSFEVVRRASMQAPNQNGIRKTRAAVVRETVRQLQDTTIKTFLDWFPPGQCGQYMRTTKTYFFKVGDVECEIMFRALDDADDVDNLNSLELTFAWFNECRDIHPDIVDAMSKRIGRFPSLKDGGPTWHGMWGDTNPPTMDGWWYYQMEHLDPKDGVSPNNNGWHVFKQPSGRSPYAENVENLPEGYYDTQGRSEEYIRVYIDGEYGLSSAGMPVYKYFRPDYHMGRESLRPILNGVRPVVIGMDLGLTPAAVVGQQDPRGRALILDECVSFDMGVQRFVRTLLKPLIYERFSGAPVLVVVDPAGVQRAQTDERSAVDIIKAEGLRVIPAKTNNVSARINAVDEFLMRQVDGDPAFVVDPRCTQLKAAMMGGYRYKPKGDGGIDKNKHSHCFVAGTMVATPVGMRAIEDIALGDLVCTPFGEQAVTASMCRFADTFVRVTFRDGSEIVCTPDHPFYTQDGVVLAEALQYTDVLYCIGEQICPPRNGPCKSSTASGTTASPRDTTKQTTFATAVGTCTRMFGSFITAPFQKVCASITRIMTRQTTALKTLKYSTSPTTPDTTQNTGLSSTPTGLGPDWKKPESQPPSGIETLPKLKKESGNWQNKDEPVGRIESQSVTTASTAGQRLRDFVEQTSADIAVLHVRQQRGLPVESMTKTASALYAETLSGLIATGKLKPAPEIVAVCISQQPPRLVFDLTVEQVHSFYANGVWVSNCAEALQYLMLHLHNAAEGGFLPQRREIQRLSAAGWT